LEKIYLKAIEKEEQFFSEKYKKFPKLIRKVIFFFICFFNILLLKKNNDKIMCILPYDINKNLSDRKANKIADKLYKHFNKEKYLLCFSHNITYKDKIKKNLVKNNNIIFVEGVWLFQYLIFIILEYIFKLQQTELKEQRIDILINEISELTYYQIKEIAQKAKRLKIVTSQIYKFKKIEEELYEKEGIAIELSNNIKKSLIKSNLIINIDFSKDILNKYKINKNAIIIHVNQKVRLDTISFNGINVYGCKIKIEKNIKDKFKSIGIYSDFSSNILYESYIYRKDIPKNIIEQIKDEVKIEYLIGSKGRINELEFKSI